MNELSAQLRRKELDVAQSLFTKTSTISVVPAYDISQSSYVILMAEKDNPSMDAYYVLQGQQGNQPSYQQLLRCICTMLTLTGYEVYVPQYVPQEVDNGSSNYAFELHLFDPYESQITFPNLDLAEAHALMGFSK